MKQPIDLRPDHAKIVHEIIARHLPAGVSVRVFGSRAKWTAKPHSDLDLALKGKEPLPRSVLGDLAEAFSESDLPFRVDVVDWHTVAPSFQAVIDRDAIKLPWPKEDFASLLAEPVRNGIYKPKEFHGRGCKIVNMGELFANSRMFDVPMKRVELTPKEQERFLLKSGDLLFARRSLTAEGAGKCSIVLEVNEPTTFESSIIRARPDRAKANPLYLYYFFSSQLGYQALDSIRRQVAVAGITGTDLANLPIPTPPESIQTKIADTLSLFDRKIELNRRMNETLEGMAQAIFRDWFVDFGPVRRKAAGEADAVAIMGGLTPDPVRAAQLAALFPDAFGDDGLPVGFAFTSLGNATSVLETGKRPKGGIKGINFGVPSIGAESIVGLAKFDFTKTKYVPREFFEKMGRGVLGRQDILLYKDGGRPGEFEPHVAMFGAGFPYSEACINEHVYRVVGQGHFSQEYLYLHLTSDDTSEEMRRKGTGVAIPGLNSRAAASLAILDPGKDLLSAFAEFAKPLFDLALSNANASKSLAETRDYLLPRLMSGTVRVALESEAA